MPGDEVKPGKGRCSVGSGGPWKIDHGNTEPGCRYPSHLIWLPKGYGPCEGQFVAALVATPFDNYELDKQLAEAVAETIEKFIWDASRRHRPVKASGWIPESSDGDEQKGMANARQMTKAEREEMERKTLELHGEFASIIDEQEEGAR